MMRNQVLSEQHPFKAPSPEGMLSNYRSNLFDSTIQKSWTNGNLANDLSL